MAIKNLHRFSRRWRCSFFFCPETCSFSVVVDPFTFLIQMLNSNCYRDALRSKFALCTLLLAMTVIEDQGPNT